MKMLLPNIQKCFAIFHVGITECFLKCQVLFRGVYVVFYIKQKHNDRGDNLTTAGNCTGNLARGNDGIVHCRSGFRLNFIFYTGNIKIII